VASNTTALYHTRAAAAAAAAHGFPDPGPRPRRASSRLAARRDSFASSFLTASLFALRNSCARRLSLSLMGSGLALVSS